MKEDDYFVEAAELFHAPDPIVARTARVLYREMLRRYDVEKMKPLEGFNIHYFFQSVSRALGGLHVRTVDTAHGSSPGAGICVVNIPAGISSHGFAQTYVELVSTESVPNGDPFDVGYAVTIATSTFTNEVLEWILDPEPREDPFESKADDDFDLWLSGFNASP